MLGYGRRQQTIDQVISGGRPSIFLREPATDLIFGGFSKEAEEAVA